MTIQRFKQFKVVSVSSNRNSFGLSGMILMARDGTAWQVGANSLNVRRKGTIINVPVFGRHHALNFAHLGYEIPERLPKAPQPVIDEVFGDEV